MSERSPLPALDCPLCGGPNACAIALSGRFDTPCWCRDATLSPALLARLPAERAALACLCPACVASAAGAAA